MPEKVLLSQPFEDGRSSFISVIGEARRDFYAESVGFGMIKLFQHPGHEDPSVIVKFTDLDVVCGVPLLRFPGRSIGEILLDDTVLQSAVLRSAAERDERPEVPLPNDWAQ